MIFQSGTDPRFAPWRAWVMLAFPAHGESVSTFSSSLSVHCANGFVSHTPAAVAAVHAIAHTASAIPVLRITSHLFLRDRRPVRWRDCNALSSPIKARPAL